MTEGKVVIMVREQSIQSDSAARRGVQKGARLARNAAARVQHGVLEGEGRRLSQGLALFSLGLGVAELSSPGAVAELIGVNGDDEEYRSLIRACGIREITSGLGLLRESDNAGWLWSRVGGDVMDLALLGAAYAAPKARRGKLALATAAVLGVTLLDVLGSQRLRRRGTPVERRLESSAIEVRRTITIRKSPEELYRFWRKLENLPQFMSHLAAVHEIDERRSHWKAKAPAGMHVEWDAEIVEDQPNRMIAWCSLEGSQIDNVGRVRFVPAPAGRGTEVHVELSYRPPGGSVGRAIAMLFGEEPSQQIMGDLRRLKQVMETGEVLHSDASIHALPHPAQPPARSQGGDRPLLA